MEKEKRKNGIDEDSSGRPWLSYLLFAVAAFVIMMFGVLGTLYLIIMQMNGPRCMWR